MVVFTKANSRILLTVLVVLLQFAPGFARQYTWDGLPSGTGYTIFGSSFVNAQNGWIAGGNNGLMFEKQVSGLTSTTWFETVEAVTVDVAWVLSTSDILKTTDGGLTWVKHQGYCDDISFAGVHNGWRISASSISKSTNGGETWQQQYVSPKTLYAVYALNDKYCWAAGSEGSVVMTSDGGVTWSVQTTGTTKRLTDIFFINERRGWAVGIGGTILGTTDGGINWIPQISGITEDLNSVHFADSIHGGIAANRATILVTNDGGNAWTAKPELKWPPYDLMSIRYASPSIAYAAGAYGTILKTTDGGSTWKSVTAGTTARLHGMDMAGEGIWIVGSSNTILKMANAFIARTTNGGDTWTKQAGNTSSTLYDIFATDVVTAFAAGGEGTILKTADGGISWNHQNSGVTHSLNDIFMLNSLTGWIVGNSGTILKTTNGGDEWVKLTTGTTDSLHAIFFTDNQNGFAVGSFGTLLETENGGSSWVVRSVSVNHLRSVCFINSSTGFICGLYGTILRTDDGGESWRPLYCNYPAHFQDIRFIDNTGWMAGSGGVILKTDTGGELWVKQPGVPTEDIFSLHAVSNNLVFATGRKGTLLRSSSQQDVSSPVISLSQPSSGQIINRADEPVRVAGTIADANGIACTVNGEYVSVNDGILDSRVAVSPLRTSMIVKAADQAGNTSTAEIPLKFRVSLPAASRKYYLGSNNDLVGTHINSSIRYEVFLYEEPWSVEFSKVMTEDLLVSSYGYAISIFSGTKAYSLSWYARRNGRMTHLAKTTRRLDAAGLQTGVLTAGDHLLLQGDTLVFRIEGAYLGGFSWGASSTSGYVTVGSETGTMLSPPSLVTPANNAVKQPISLQLTWKKSKGATGYITEVNDAEDLTTPKFRFPAQSDSVLQLSDLKYATKYYWRVAAINANDTSEWSAVWNFTTLAETLTPTLQASAIHFSEITATTAVIHWTPGNGSQSLVFIRAGAGAIPILENNFSYTASPVFGTGSNAGGSEWFCIYRGAGSECSVTGLSPLKSYTVRVFTFHGDPGSEKYLNQEAPGNPAGFMTECDRDYYGANPLVHLYYKSPDVYDVEITNAHSCGTTTIKFMNIAVSGGAFTIQVNAYPNSGTMHGTRSADGSTFSGSYNISYAFLHPVYGYSVSCGTKSGSWVAVRGSNSPAAPTLTSPPMYAGNVVTSPLLQWNPVAEASSYTLQVSENPAFESLLVDQTNITATEYSIDGLKEGTTYYWRVASENTCFTSPWSSVWSFETATTLPDPPVLMAPANGTTEPSGEVHLAWHVSGKAASYKLQVSLNHDFATIFFESAGLQDTTHTLTGLAGGTTWYWRVAATGPGGTGAWSQTWYFSVKKEIKTPQTQASGVQVSDITGREAKIKWEKGDGEKTILFVKAGDGGVAAPGDQITNIPDNGFGKGSELSPEAWYCIYLGTGTETTVRDLAPQTIYTVMAISLNGDPGEEKYLRLIAAGNPVTFRTLCDNDFYGLNPLVHLYYKNRDLYDTEITLTHSCGTTTLKFFDVPVVGNAFTIQVNAWPNSGNMSGTLTADRKSASGTYNINFAMLHPQYGYSVSCGNRTGTWSATASPCIPSSTGITQTEQFKLYPNPVVYRLYFEGPFRGYCDFSIYNSGGQMVRQIGGYLSDGLDVQDLPGGIYFLRISGEGGTLGSVFIKKQNH